MAFYFVSTFAIAQTPTKQPALRLSRTKNLHFAKAPFPGFSANVFSRNGFFVQALTNCGTTILLGIHSSYWDMACRKLQIDKNILKFIRPKQAAAVKLQRNGAMESKFVNAIINETIINEQ